MFIADVLVDFAKSTFQNVYFAKSTILQIDNTSAMNTFSSYKYDFFNVYFVKSTI